MGLDKNNIPDEYLCEICKPRPIDRKKAKALQSRRRTELFNNSSSSDEGDRRLTAQRRKGGGGGKDSIQPKKSSSKKKILDRKVDHHAHHSGGGESLINKKKLGKGIYDGKLSNGSTKENMMRQDLMKTSSGNKKQQKKRKPSGKESKVQHHQPPRSGSRRKSQTSFSNDSNEEELDDDDFDLESKPDASQQLRSWIDQYEEAVTNHYSPELRARLASNKFINGVGTDLKPSVIGSVTRCNVSLQGNGVKVRMLGCLFLFCFVCQ